MNACRDEIFTPRKRGRFEGVANVIRFNWPLYVIGLAVAAGAILAAAVLARPRWLAVLLWTGGIAASYLLVASVLVSLWVYDLSPLYRFEWARRAVAGAPARILNLHSGFDESSIGLRAVFPDAVLQVMDFYDPQRMTEPSIARARAYQSPHRPADVETCGNVSPAALPAEARSIDAAFAVLAAHEIRRPDDRARFFSELHRVLRDDGRVVVVEHLRNVANFLAFGPQFTHFFSRRTWLAAARSAGLELLDESRITPFVGVFVFAKRPGTAA